MMDIFLCKKVRSANLTLADIIQTFGRGVVSFNSQGVLGYTAGNNNEIFFATVATPLARRLGLSDWPSGVNGYNLKTVAGVAVGYLQHYLIYLQGQLILF